MYQEDSSSMNQMTRARVSKTESKREHGNHVVGADELLVGNVGDDCDLNEHQQQQHTLVP